MKVPRKGTKLNNYSKNSIAFHVTIIEKSPRILFSQK
jgi:hypothetical protein